MSIVAMNLLGQDDGGGGWTSLIYIALVVILPALKSFGEWIRKKTGASEEDGPDGTAVDESPGARALPTRVSRPVAQAGHLFGEGLPEPVAAPAARRVVRPVAEARVPTPPMIARGSRGQRSEVPAVPRAKPIRERAVGRATRSVVQPVATARTVGSPEASAWQERLTIMERSMRAGEGVDPRPVSRSRSQVLVGPVDAASLRRAVVMSELLQKPVGLRDDWFYSW
jgi:hypothetical protein